MFGGRKIIQIYVKSRSSDWQRQANVTNEKTLGCTFYKGGGGRGGGKGSGETFLFV